VEYFKEPKRGYGGSIRDVFVALRMSECEDPYGPARRQFQGMGSFGNGAAMRVAPVTLFHHNDVNKLVELATMSSKLTHSNRLGYRGAVLQALAIYQALHTPPEELNKKRFVSDLIAKMEDLEKGDEVDEFEVPKPNNSKSSSYSYVKKLQLVDSFLCKPEPPTLDEVQNSLGVDVSAHGSVPTAIYCFLAAQEPLPNIEVFIH
jgi:poly(ADP-ribose) glycohydrolase ARH3